MIAELIGIGFTEQAELEASARLAAQELESCDVRLTHACAIDADAPQLRRAIARALGRSDIVLLLGGLSAGEDGIAKQTVCDGLGRRLVLHEQSLERIREAYRQAGRQMPQQVSRLAMMPEQSVVFPGVRGITPGCALSAGSQYILILPEAPKEFVPMLQSGVVPYLARFSEAAVVSRTVNVFGLSEGQVSALVDPLMQGQNPQVTVLERAGEVQVRITARAQSKREANAACLPIIQKARNLLGAAAYGVDEKNLPSAAARLLIEQRLSVAVGESDAGGLLSRWLNAQPEAQDFLQFTATADADRQKIEALGVPKKLLKKFGSESAQVAAAMAMGACERGQSRFGLGLTAGDKRGDCYAAVCDGERVWVRKISTGKGAAADYRAGLSAMGALDLLRRCLGALPDALEGSSSRKAALGGKLAEVEAFEPEKAAKAPKAGRAAPEKKRSFFGRAFPVRGDSGADVMRKCVLLCAVLIFSVSIGYLGYFQLEGKVNQSLQSDLESMYVAGMDEQDVSKLVIPDDYPKGYQKKFANLFQINPDVSGWINIPGTQVNYPVVQYSDNDFYMRRDFRTNPSKYGTPWLEAENTMEPQSSNYVIYGHNMTDGQMFGELMKYKGQDGLAFLKEHPIVKFDDVYRDNTYQIFSVFITNAKSQYGEVFFYNEETDFESDAEFNAFVQEVKDRSYYDSDVDVKPGDHLITLSTCSYEFGPVSDDAHVRTVIVARRLRLGEKANGGSFSYEKNPDFKLPPGFGGTATAAPSAQAVQVNAQQTTQVAAAHTEQKAASDAAASSKAASDAAAASKAASDAAAASKAASDAAAASKAASDAAAASKAASDAAAASKAASDAAAASKAASDAAASEAAASKAAASSRAASREAARLEEERLEEERLEAEEEARREEEEEDDRAPSGGGDKLTIVANGSKLTGSASDIVAKVVTNEMGASFSEEALKAQAVAAYTFISQQNASGITPYLGVKTPPDSIRDLVDEVAGEAVYYKNSLAFTPFYATSAGVTVSSKEVWGGSYAYLVSVDSEIDEMARNYEYTVTLSANEVAKKVKSVMKVDLWDYSDDPDEWFSILSYTDGGRYVKEIEAGNKTTSGRAFREQVFGLRSAAFEIDYDSRSEKFTFTTYGYGHGVGMSQTGANLYATEEGWDYEEILTHYYPGCKVR